jgi:hypothetical protein
MKSEAQVMAETAALAGRRSGSYDPCAPDNIVARRHDNESDGLEWEEIILTTQEDSEAGRYSFNSEGHATDVETIAAIGAWIHRLAEETWREAASVSSLDATG